MHRGNVWERAKSPALRRYCDLLASASSKLAGANPAASAALDAGHEAEAVFPGTAAVRVVEGRALAALGRLPDALAAFEDARARDARAFDEPVALLALARALAAGGRTADASGEYRALLPRASGLPVADRTCIATEAGLVAMQLGPASIDEATADLREALRTAQGEAEKFDVLALALALDRAGTELRGPNAPGGAVPGRRADGGERLDPERRCGRPPWRGGGPHRARSGSFGCAGRARRVGGKPQGFPRGPVGGLC